MDLLPEGLELARAARPPPSNGLIPAGEVVWISRPD